MHKTTPDKSTLTHLNALFLLLAQAFSEYSARTNGMGHSFIHSFQRCSIMTLDVCVWMNLCVPFFQFQHLFFRWCHNRGRSTQGGLYPPHHHLPFVLQLTITFQVTIPRISLAYSKPDMTQDYSQYFFSCFSTGRSQQRGPSTTTRRGWKTIGWLSLLQVFQLGIQWMIGLVID